MHSGSSSTLWKLVSAPFAPEYKSGKKAVGLNLISNNKIIYLLLHIIREMWVPLTVSLFRAHFALVNLRNLCFHRWNWSSPALFLLLRGNRHLIIWQLSQVVTYGRKVKRGNWSSPVNLPIWLTITSHCMIKKERLVTGFIYKTAKSL